jgi:hypothetical protein
MRLETRLTIRTPRPFIWLVEAGGFGIAHEEHTLDVIAGVHCDRDARQTLSRMLTRISFGLSSMFSSTPIVNETAYEWSFFLLKITGEPTTLR